MKSTLRYFQNTTGKALKKLTFFSLLLKQQLEHTRALISIQNHSGALQSAQESLMRTQEYSGALIALIIVRCHGAMSTHECC